MIGLPNFGDRVKIWPMPGRRVLASPFAMDAPLLAQAVYLPKSGREVVWDYYWHEQMKSGDILLHPPPCEEHDHGQDGIDDCMHCGRTLDQAQVYDVHYAHGVAAAEADAKERAKAAQPDPKADQARKDAVAKTKKSAADAAAAAEKALAPKPEAQPLPKQKSDPVS